MVVRNTARRMEAGNGDKAWFAAKRYGYGSSLPIAWQGWVVALAYCVTVTLSAWLVLPHSVFAFVAIILGATAAFILVCAMKTRGGWHWRWARMPSWGGPGGSPWHAGRASVSPY